MKKLILITTLTMTVMLTACGNAATPSAAMPDTVKIQNTERNVITVTASNEVKIVPDIAEITFGVYTEAKSAADCQEKNSESINKVIEYLKGFGVTEKSIQTTGYNLTPKYDWSNDVQRVVGYEIRTRITISELPLDKVGNVLAESVNAGINDIESITYQSSTYDESYQEALKLAISTAKTKAEAMAEAGGCTLGGVVRIEERYNQSEARNTTYLNQKEAAGMGMNEAAVADVSVMPGEVSVEAYITADFIIQ